MQNNRREGRSMFSLAGWLFADLLLAMTTIFIVASAVGVYVPPTPKSKPTPTVLPRLELKFHRFTVSIDPNGLLNGDPNASASVKKQIRSESFLKGRSAGLVIIYGGAPGVSDISTALDIANKMYDVIGSLGKEGFVFSRASHYDPLFLLGGDSSVVTVDIFLFVS